VAAFLRPLARAGSYYSPVSLERLSSKSQWFWIASIWLGLALFDATQTVFVMRSEGMHHAWGRLFITLLVAWLPWACATPLVLRLGREHPLSQWTHISIWAIHIGACLTIGLVYAAWRGLLVALLNPWANPTPSPFKAAWLNEFENGLLAYFILYGTVLAVGSMLDSRQRLAQQQTEAARLSEQLSKAQLSVLRHQIEPHFLFNSLNAIAGLVRENRNDDAVSMIAGLSDFLRRILKDSHRQEVPLAEEMDFLQGYLDVQKVRFADRLHLSVDVPQELLVAQVPNLILQPMVENAVKHGIAKRAQGGTIRIRASRLNAMLTLSIFNDGPSLTADWETTGSGIGISNVRTRLRSLYGDSFDLRLQNQDNGVEVSVSVPFREA
jgi:two-component system LytT family sensor kinase